MAVALLTSCGKSLSGAGGEVTGVRSVAFNEPSPYGMVLIKRGSFEMGPADKDFPCGGSILKQKVFRLTLSGWTKRK